MTSLDEHRRRAVAKNPTHVTVEHHHEAVRAFRFVLTEVNRMRDLAPPPQDLASLVSWLRREAPRSCRSAPR